MAAATTTLNAVGVWMTCIATSKLKAYINRTKFELTPRTYAGLFIIASLILHFGVENYNIDKNGLGEEILLLAVGGGFIKNLFLAMFCQVSKTVKAMLKAVPYYFRHIILPWFFYFIEIILPQQLGPRITTIGVIFLIILVCTCSSKIIQINQAIVMVVPIIVMICCIATNQWITLVIFAFKFGYIIATMMFLFDSQYFNNITNKNLKLFISALIPVCTVTIVFNCVVFHESWTQAMQEAIWPIIYQGCCCYFIDMNEDKNENKNKNKQVVVNGKRNNKKKNKKKRYGKNDRYF